MARAKRDPLMRGLEDLIGDHSMPEVVAALIRVTRAYKEKLQGEGSSESAGWQSWETVLSTALAEAAGPEDLKELAGG